MFSIRTYLLGGSIAVALIVGTLYVRERDQRIRNSAAASTRIERDSIELISLKDSLRVVDRKTDTIRVAARGQFTVYDTLRKKIVFTDTSRFVVVETSFVRTADSVRRTCEALDKSCAEQRITSGLIIKNLEDQNSNLKILVESQPSTKMKWVERFVIASVSASSGYGACKLREN